jgi:hypothetical protein
MPAAVLAAARPTRALVAARRTQAQAAARPTQARGAARPTEERAPEAAVPTRERAAEPAPASIGPVHLWWEMFDGINGECGLAIGNGDGTMAQLKTDRIGHPSWTLIDANNGSDRAIYGLYHGELYAGSTVSGAESHFLSYVDEGAFHFDISGVADNGASRKLSASMHLYADEHVAAMDPRGELLAVAGAISVDGQPNRRRLMNQSFGPVDLDRDAAIFGMGVNGASQILVIQAGGCDGCISGQWFNVDLSAATGSFTLVIGFVPGPSTWFETAQLIGTGLAVRRMDANSCYPYQSQWLVTIDGGSTSPQPAPAWLAARPNANIMIVRNQHAYAVLPNGTKSGACTQRLEIASPTGASCAHYDLDLAAGLCDTSELRVGFDGTILQHTPTELERNPSGRPQSCTLRYWPAALH